MTENKTRGDSSPDEGRGLDWFEEVYHGAAGDGGKVPWADFMPNRFLTDWLDLNWPAGDGRSALVVGCGLGDDAEEMARRGFAVTAFDISPSALAWSKERHPDSAVDYQLADLFDPPPEYLEAYDVIIEIYTVHALDAHLRPGAMRAIASFVKPDGELFFLCRGRDDGPPPSPDPPPHPLCPADLAPFADAGLRELSFADLEDVHDGKFARRFRVHYKRSKA